MPKHNTMHLECVSQAIDAFADDHGLSREEAVNFALSNWAVSHALMQAAPITHENATKD